MAGGIAAEAVAQEFLQMPTKTSHADQIGRASCN